MQRWHRILGPAAHVERPTPVKLPRILIRGRISGSFMAKLLDGLIDTRPEMARGGDDHVQGIAHHIDGPRRMVHGDERDALDFTEEVMGLHENGIRKGPSQKLVDHWAQLHDLPFAQRGQRP